MAEPKVIIMDSQVLNAVQGCGLKYDYSFNRKLSPINKPSYFDKGDLFHRMLKFYYNIKKNRPKWSTEALIDNSIRVGRKHSIHLRLPIEDCERVIHWFLGYHERWKNDRFKILHVEKIFAFELHRDDNLVVIWQGRSDLVVQYSQFNTVTVLDHKSGSRDIEPSRLSNQFMGYAVAWGTQQVVINKINFYKNKEIDSMSPQQLATYENQSGGKPFKRYVLCYDRDLLAWWKDWVVYWAYVLKGYIEKGLYPPNLTSCDKYAGCIFRDICKHEPKAREFVIQSRYKKVPLWDVGKSLEEGDPDVY